MSSTVRIASPSLRNWRALRRRASAATCSPTSPSSSTASASRPRGRIADARVDRTRPAHGSRHDPLPATARAGARGLPRPRRGPRSRAVRRRARRRSARPARSASTTAAASRSTAAAASSAALRRCRPGPLRVRRPATRRRAAAAPRLVVGKSAEPTTLDELRATLGERARALRRSIHIRHVDAGSDGAEEWEIQALIESRTTTCSGSASSSPPRPATPTSCSSPAASPRRCARRSSAPGRSMPEPKAVVAAGTDACSGGLAAPACHAGGVDRVLPVDVYVPGSPPSPIALLHGLLLATGVLARRRTHERRLGVALAAPRGRRSCRASIAAGRRSPRALVGAACSRSSASAPPAAGRPRASTSARGSASATQRSAPTASPGIFLALIGVTGAAVSLALRRTPPAAPLASLVARPAPARRWRP